MFYFLKNKHNGVMVFDPTETDLDVSQFPTENWSASVYGECKEEILLNVSQPRGIGFTMRTFFDFDHSGETVTH